MVQSTFKMPQAITFMKIYIIYYEDKIIWYISIFFPFMYICRYICFKTTQKNYQKNAVLILQVV